ncbi:MAG: mechanosensitive ion channel [Planctomycetes bacterium]|nr:mechanosensitive ion channel [Planctomycetota bacterium]
MAADTALLVCALLAAEAGAGAGLGGDAGDAPGDWLTTVWWLLPVWKWLGIVLALGAAAALARTLEALLFARLLALVERGAAAGAGAAANAARRRMRGPVWTFCLAGGGWTAFVLFAQPVVSAATADFVHAGALVATLAAGAVGLSRAGAAAAQARLSGTGWPRAFEQEAAAFISRGGAFGAWTAAGAVFLLAAGAPAGVAIAALLLALAGAAAALGVGFTEEMAGLRLLLRRPFAVGDRVRVRLSGLPPLEGRVTGAGLRGVEIAGDDGALTRLSATQATAAVIENLSASADAPVSFDLVVPSFATAEQIRGALARLRRAVMEEPCVDAATVEVRFAGFSDRGFILNVAFAARAADALIRAAARERVNFRLLETLDQLGLTLPPPLRARGFAGEAPCDPAVPPPPASLGREGGMVEVN